MLVCLLVGRSGSAVIVVSVDRLSARCLGAGAVFAGRTSGGGVGLAKKAEAPANSLVIPAVSSCFFIGEKLRQSVCHMLGQILLRDYSQKCLAFENGRHEYQHCGE